MSFRRCALALLLLPFLTLDAQRTTAPRPAPTPRPAVAPRSAVKPRPRAEPRHAITLDDDRMHAEWDAFDADFALKFDESHWRDLASTMRSEALAKIDASAIELEALAQVDAISPRLSTTIDTKISSAIALDFAIDKSQAWASARAYSPTLSSTEWEGAPLLTRARAPWLQGDPADSLYRQARELLNNGEYRRAAAAFRDLASRMPNSGYAADALYWQAFALYRMGGTTELRSAIESLEQQKDKYPGARLKAESEALSLRIRGALAARGDAAAAATIRTAAGDSALRCDREEQAVRVEALNALTQSDPDGAMPVLQKTLTRRDSCSALLRRTAVFLIGSRRRDGSGVPLLAQVAKTDPSVEVRASALEWLARSPGDEALNTIEQLTRDDSDERVQRAAMRALVSNQSPRARQLVRGIVERNETPEKLRLEALGAFDKERATSEDVNWMRTLYTRTDNARIKARIVNTLSNIGGPEVDQWLLTMARNADESSDTRRYALRRVGRTLPIAELAKLYDSASERPIREMLIETLAQRAEGEATDKLLEIVKTGTDPQLRSRAISALTSKKDPRTLRLLMEIIDK